VLLLCDRKINNLLLFNGAIGSTPAPGTSFAYRHFVFYQEQFELWNPVG